MNAKRLWNIFQARNREFFRDRAAFGWNFLFPFLIVAGFGIIFGHRSYSEYKIGIFPYPNSPIASDSVQIPAGFHSMHYLKFIGFSTRAEGLDKLGHHKIDFLLKLGQPPYEYYVSDSSPKGYVLEQMFKASLIPAEFKIAAVKKEIHTGSIRYIDWLFPGISKELLAGYFARLNISAFRDKFIDKMVGMNQGRDFYIDKKRNHGQVKGIDRYLAA
jgi:ABC-2 type transport system permease protein